MNQSFYMGATAAQQQNLRMSIQGNNIANVNTHGFKGEKGRFQALMYDRIQAAEGELTTGTGGALMMSSTDYTPGAAASTGRTLDFMVEGDGFFGLVDLRTNEISLTRNGAFTKAQLKYPSEEVDQYGMPVMEDRWYLSDGEGRFVLSASGGMIEVKDPEEELPVGIFDYINYDGMRHLNDTRFLPVDKNGGLRMGSGTLRQGMLELSNVDLADEITKVIESQRAYQMALKLVQTSDEIETTINGLRN